MYHITQDRICTPASGFANLGTLHPAAIVVTLKYFLESTALKDNFLQIAWPLEISVPKGSPNSNRRAKLDD
jgi:hypothetical protein